MLEVNESLAYFEIVAIFQSAMITAVEHKEGLLERALTTTVFFPFT